MRVTAEAPRPLPPLASLLLFRDGVAPAWDDPANVGGGRVVLAVRREEGEAIWSDLMAAALAAGESVIKYKSPLNVLKDTYDHSIY